VASEVKARFLDQLQGRFGLIRKLPGSQSMFELGSGAARLYLRYSKVHSGNRTFYGLRQQDLRQLEGLPSFIVFLWDGQTEPLIVRHDEYEEVFHSVPPAPDGQYKTQVLLDPQGTELYVANAGRFNVEGDFGWNGLHAAIDSSQLLNIPLLTHCQVQTLLGAIGTTKGFDVWIPASDRERLDWSVAQSFCCRETLPAGFGDVGPIIQEVDVIWVRRGSNEVSALFEVEHSTPIYSGLLRFNDVHLVAPQLRPRFSVVANEARRDLFVRQLRRPTFRLSGLSEMCNFLEYVDVFGWHRRISQPGTRGEAWLNETTSPRGGSS
jgi:hypothetical protein